MTANQGPPGKPPRRLSPSELAEEVAKRLKSGGSGRGGHRRQRRFDIVTASRVAMVLGVVLLGVGAVFAVAWIGRLAGFETTGTVIDGTPLFGCPGEPEVGVLFSGETVELVGRSEDGAWFAVRDDRGPGNVVYADALRISPEKDADRLSVRSCDPRDADEVAAASITSDPGQTTTTTSGTTTTSTTTTPGETTTTGPATGAGGSGRPPRRNTPSPGTTTTTTTTTTRPGGTTTTTRPGTTTTTRPGSTSSSTSTTSTS
ncbi:MAG: hypothetical protein M3N43_00940, partial [Actinomycetota bacterium]|nr:hypothetical protein [Actinomycetota bacterium]